jgi:hypothetical protein
MQNDDGYQAKVNDRFYDAIEKLQERVATLEEELQELRRLPEIEAFLNEKARREGPALP